MATSKNKLPKPMLFLLLSLLLLLLVVFFFLPIVSVLGPDTLFRGVKDYVSMLIEKNLHIRIMMFLLPIIVLLLLFPLLSMVYPSFSLFFERLFRYPSLFFVCLRKKRSFKINGFKFSSSYIIDERPNVIVSDAEITYFLHFLDIPKADKRVVVFQNTNEYRIYETIKSGRKKTINYNSPLMENEDIPKVFRKRSRFLDDNNYQTFKIPQFQETDSQVHMILVSPHFLYSKYLSGNVHLDIGRETQIGATLISKFKNFKKNI